MALKSVKKYLNWFRLEISLELTTRKLMMSSTIQSAAFVLLMFQGIMDPVSETWITFFWLIILFASISGLYRSFLSNTRSTQLYLYQLFTPFDYYILRVVTNFIYIVVLSVLCLILLWVFYGSIPVSIPGFMLLILAGSLGFAALFTFTGALASTSQSAGVLLPLLSIPLLIPLLMILFTATKQLVIGSEQDPITLELLLIFALDLLYLLPGLFLFPHLWADPN